MDGTYRATYINSSGRQFPATVFLSKVTLTIRYKDELNQEKDVYWLAERIQKMESSAFDTRLHYPSENGLGELLVVREQQLTEAIKQTFRSYKFSGAPARHRMFSTARSKFFLLLSIILGIIAIIYLWILPWIGEKVAMSFSKANEIELGESMYRSTIAGFKIDQEKTRAVNEFYRSLNYAIDYPISITVVESEDLNAFAIPGGHIVIYDALLNKMTKPEELAALLGHEGSHISRRHSLRSLFRGLARKMFIMLIVGNDAGIVSYIADNADALKGLEYSRSLETEADNNGIRLMHDNKINTQGMLGLMELLQSSSNTAAKEPYPFLSTHPVFKDRIDNIRKQISLHGRDGETPTTVREKFKAITGNW